MTLLRTEPERGRSRGSRDRRAVRVSRRRTHRVRCRATRTDRRRATPGPRGTPPRSGVATPADTAERATSRATEPSDAGGGETTKTGKLRFESAAACVRQPIRHATIARRQGFDVPEALEAPKGAVQRPGSDRRAGNDLDVLHHRVAMLRSLRQTDEDVESRLGEAPEVERVMFHVISPNVIACTA